MAGVNLTILNGTDGVSQVMAGIVGQGLSILETLRGAAGSAAANGGPAIGTAASEDPGRRGAADRDPARDSQSPREPGTRHVP
jgi:flotillin